MSIHKIAKTIVDDCVDADRTYNWRNDEFRVYYNVRTKKIWGRFEHFWEAAQTDDDIVRLFARGYTPTEVKKLLRRAIKFADKGWREVTVSGRPLNSVNGYGWSMEKF